MNDEYAAKMALKSDAELRQYVVGRAQYREEAVLAALTELTNRGQPHADTDAIRAELLPIVAEHQQAALVTQQAAEEEANPLAEPAAVAGPPLYSPIAIALFSFLFSFLAGGILFTINLFRLEEKGRAWRMLLFTFLYLVAIVVILNWLLLALGNQAQAFVFASNIVAILAYLLYFWPRYIGERSYVSRQWLPALLVCLGLVWLLARLALHFRQVPV